MFLGCGLFLRKKIVMMNKTTVPVILNNRVFIIKDEITKSDLVEKLVGAICADLPAVDKDDVLKAVNKREQGISTTLDTGLSIPHARLEDINVFHTAAAILPQGITDEHGMEIKVMFLFLSPGGQAFFAQHLRLLASLAERFKTPFIEELCACQTPQEAAAKLSF